MTTIAASNPASVNPFAASVMPKSASSGRLASPIWRAFKNASSDRWTLTAQRPVPKVDLHDRHQPWQAPQHRDAAPGRLLRSADADDDARDADEPNGKHAELTLREDRSMGSSASTCEA